MYRSLYSAPKDILHTYVLLLMMNFQAPLTMSSSLNIRADSLNLLFYLNKLNLTGVIL